MEEWFEDRVRQVLTTPPECLSGFQLAPLTTDPAKWKNWVAWALTCKCGSNVGKVLGHSLKELDANRTGQDFYVSPLVFHCGACGLKTDIIDTDLHGYDAECGKLDGPKLPATTRGAGEGKPIPCPHCQATDFAVIAHCSHSHFDLIEDEPELEPRTQEYFDAFDCHGVCKSCGKDSSLTHFELA